MEFCIVMDISRERRKSGKPRISAALSAPYYPHPRSMRKTPEHAVPGFFRLGRYKGKQ